MTRAGKGARMIPWRWRIQTWVLIAWSVLAPMWWLYALYHMLLLCNAFPGNACPPYLYASSELLFVVIMAVPLVGTPLLIRGWFKSRPPRLFCQECGRRLRQGHTHCRECGTVTLPHTPTVQGQAVRRLR